METSANQPAGPKVKIIGVGGAGSAAVEHIAKSNFGDLPLAIVHTHARVLQQRTVENKVLIGINRTHGLGTGGDFEIAKVMAENELQALQQICAGTELVFLIAGLGGGTGTGLTPVLAKAAKESGALVIAMVTMPFDFEGPRRMKQAQNGLNTLRAVADAVISIPNQKLSKLLDANTTIVNAFSHTNELLSNSVKGIWQMLTRPGLINVDFAYLYSVLRGRHVESALATAEAQGENRARDIVDQLLANPFLDGGQALATADQVLVSLAGGQDLTLAEINRIMEQLNRHIENGQLILGTAIDAGSEGKISVTLLAAKNGKGTLLSVESATETNRTFPSEPKEYTSSFIEDSETPRPQPRFVAPPPASTPERTLELMDKRSARRKGSKWTQELLNLEIVSRGRFEKSEPTIHHGADLDVPTYIRRGVPLN
ncbi:MAG: cell division protein FtsZ [Verrucomicrobiota bacterium]